MLPTDIKKAVLQHLVQVMSDGEKEGLKAKKKPVTAVVVEHDTTEAPAKEPDADDEETSAQDGATADSAKGPSDDDMSDMAAMIKARLGKKKGGK